MNVSNVVKHALVYLCLGGAVGCSEDAREADIGEYALRLFAGVDLGVRRVNEIGYWVNLSVVPGGAASGTGCLLAGADLRINGEDIETVAESDDCTLVSTVRAGPFTANTPISIALQSGNLRAEAEFEDVFPGASIDEPTPALTPSAGSSLLLHPPSALTARAVGPAVYFWTDDPSGVWYSVARGVSEGQAIEVSVPPGRAGKALLFAGIGTGTIPIKVERCSGFHSCGGDTSTTVGPIQVQVLAP